MNNSIEMINMLLRSGASCNAKNLRGETALHYAVEVGELRPIMHLAKSGAILEAEDNEGRTPMDWAVEAQNHDVIRFLVALGALPPVQERQEHHHRGQTASH